MTKITDKLYFNLICIITKIYVYLKKFINFFIDTNITDIKIVKINDNTIHHITTRYYIIKFINKYTKFLKKCTNYVIFMHNNIPGMVN